MDVSTEAAFGDLSKLLSFASAPEALDLTLRHALAALAKVVPYDLAALYELHGDTLVLRVGEGRLASKVRGHTLPLARFPSIRRALTVRQPMVLAQHDHEGDEGDPYDGVLDLLYDRSDHYNVAAPTLFLSGAAAADELVHPVAEQRTTGC